MLQIAALHELLVGRFPALARAPQTYYVVGGAVRDLLLGEHPIDVDLAGAGAEAEATAFARQTRGRTLELGRDPLRVWRVFSGERIYDFAELQGESIERDLRRRDFTLNALAYRMDEHRLIDPFGGVQDLRDGIVRMVDEQNLLDDPLRMVKAVRMAVRFGFEIEPATAAAIRRNAWKIDSVAPERVSYELDGILSSSRPASGLSLLRNLGLDLFSGPTAPTVDLADPEIVLALALRDRSEEGLRDLAERWRWSGARADTLVAFRRALDDRRAVEISIYDAGSDLAPRIASFLEEADSERAGEFRRVLETDGTRIFGTAALLDGDEIVSLTSVARGPELGRIKRALLEAQLLGAVKSRDDAIAFVAEAARR